MFYSAYKKNEIVNYQKMLQSHILTDVIYVNTVNRSEFFLFFKNQYKRDNKTK